MVSKEQALMNYMSLIKFLISNYDELTDKIYSTPCLNYKDNCFFEETDPFKIVLQWNMFYRKNIYYFYKHSVIDDVDIINKFIKKNNLEINKFKSDLDFLKQKCEENFLLYENAICTSDYSDLNVKETVAETMDIFNDLKNMSFQTQQFKRYLDLEFKKRFYQFQIFKNLAGSMKYRQPNLAFSIGVKTKISDFIFDLIEE